MLKRCFVLFSPLLASLACLFLNEVFPKVQSFDLSVFDSISQHLYMWMITQSFSVLELPAHPSICVCLTDVCHVHTLRVLQDEYVLNWCLLPPEANLASANGLCLDLWSISHSLFTHIISWFLNRILYTSVSLSYPFYFCCQLLWLRLLLPSGFLFCFVCLRSNFSSLSSPSCVLLLCTD